MKPWVKYVRILTNLVIFLALAALVIFFGPKLLMFFMPFVLGWIISLIANPLVQFLEKHVKIVRKISSVIIIIGVLALVCLGGYALISWLVHQIGSFLGNFPSYYKGVMEELQGIIDSLDGVMKRLPIDIRENIQDFGDESVTMVTNWVKNLSRPAMTAASNAAKNLPSLFISFFVTLLAAYFFTADHDKMMAKCREITPLSMQHTMRIVRESFSSTVGGYFKAQFKIMGVVALILIGGLLIMGVDYAVFLGILIAFLDMLPFLGTGTVLFPWALLKVLNQNYRMAIGLVILYAVTQVVRQIIQPKLIGDSIGLSPLPTLMFIYIGYQIGGFFGMLIAIPVGMIIIELYRKGMFDSVVMDLKEIVEDINRFRRRPAAEEKNETEEKKEKA